MIRVAFYREPSSNSAASNWSVLHCARSDPMLADTSYCPSSVSLSEIELTTGRGEHKCPGGLLLNVQPAVVDERYFLF